MKTKEGVDIFKTPSGWCKRLPDCILGPFQSRQEAISAYKTEKNSSEKKDYSKKKEKVAEVIS